MKTHVAQNKTSLKINIFVENFKHNYHVQENIDRGLYERIKRDVYKIQGPVL